MIALPERGRIGIFNRSHYEECLVVRVHPEILAKQKIPPKLVTKDIWRDRFEDISAMERYVARNGTVILKFFLNVSREEQRERFLERLEDPAKNWKFSLADIGERKLWDKYQAAYQDLIRHTSTKHAPWHIVPADHKWFARVVIGSAIVAALDRLDLHFPKVDKADRSEFKQVREALLAEEKGGEGEEVGWAEAQLAPCPPFGQMLWRNDWAHSAALPEPLPAFSGVLYATNFLYNQRRPSWRRQTCPRTSRPVMLRLGMMTRRRCQVVGLAVRRSNPNLRDVDGCKSDRCHADPLLKLPAAHCGQAGHSAPAVKSDAIWPASRVENVFHALRTMSLAVG